jgi:glycosyltransferase involved in cell wall biosynthesis
MPNAKEKARTMKIAQIAPLHESVPPKLYGGTERIVSYLTEELVARGHDVMLFASADSVTRAQLIPASETSLRLSPMPVVDTVAHYIRLLGLVFRQAQQFDALHFHIDYLHFPFTKRQHVPAVTTLHGNLSIPDLVPLYEEFREMNVVSISDAQRQPLPWIGWCGTVYESISNRGLCGLLLNFQLLFVLHSQIPANEGLPELVIEHLRSDLQ